MTQYHFKPQAIRDAIAVLSAAVSSDLPAGQRRPGSAHIMAAASILEHTRAMPEQPPIEPQLKWSYEDPEPVASNPRFDELELSIYEYCSELHEWFSVREVTPADVHPHQQVLRGFHCGMHRKHIIQQANNYHQSARWLYLGRRIA